MPKPTKRFVMRVDGKMVPVISWIGIKFTDEEISIVVMMANTRSGRPTLSTYTIDWWERFVI